MGDHIRTARESRKLSTQAAAARAEISPGYLFKLESGFVGTPSPRVLHRLSGVLGVGYWDLMDLAGYVVPADHGAPPAARPAGAAPLAEPLAEPLDTPPAAASEPLDRIAAVLEVLLDELRMIRKSLAVEPAEPIAPAEPSKRPAETRTSKP